MGAANTILASVYQLCPDEILRNIIAQLPTKERLAVSFVCKRWHRLCLESFIEDKQLCLHWTDKTDPFALKLVC